MKRCELVTVMTDRVASNDQVDQLIKGNEDGVTVYELGKPKQVGADRRPLSQVL